ncbi:MAG: hypothetical protein JSR68_08260 [Proteobacteria bacterium]|nr:hypothetical protein [Pseudomonadota bacterium]
MRTRDAVATALREAAPERDFRALIDLVREALNRQVNIGRPPGDRLYASIEAIYADRVVAEVSGRYYQYGYSIVQADGVDRLVLGRPVEVIEQYVPTGAAPAAEPAAEPAASVPVTVARDARFREAADGSIEVTLIRAGRSGNRNYYPDAALREAAPQFEGVRVFAKSDSEHVAGGGKDVRNLIGGIYGVRFVEGATPDTGALVGTFKPISPTDPVVVKMTEAVARGMQGLLGLSIDALARTKARTEGGQRLREAVKFTKVNSVDLIVEPGAGGGLDRLAEAAPETTLTQPQGSTMPQWKKRMLDAIQRKDAAKYAAIDPDTIADGEVVALYEAVCGEVATAAVPGTSGTRLTEGHGGGDDAPVTRAELQLLAQRQAAAARIAASTLPQPAKERLQARFAEAARCTPEDVTAAIAAEGEYIARMTESGAVRVPAFGAGSITVGDRAATARDMLDAFFDPAHADHRRVHSFRECYVEITGDRRVTGRLADVDMSRLRESLGDEFREALTSASWGEALGNAITRRMQAIYTGLTDLQTWRRVVSWVPVNDFRTQERVRIGGYGNLPAVAEAGPYTALTSPGDDKATYAISKRGGTESVTLEMITNDDVQAIRRIPQELALAAGHTLHEFVFDFYKSNSTIYDTKALYHADHGNLFTAALDAAEFAKHRLAMLKATRAGSGKRLATPPARLLVPFELQETAYNLFVRNANLDKTFVQTINPEVIAVSYWTDANDWVTVADPAVLPVLEIGFLRGQEEPELFVQDMPNAGSMFSNDQITYKIRHIYGGAVLVDGEKGTTKAVVA